MTVIPGTFLPGDDDGSGIAREPATDDPAERAERVSDGAPEEPVTDAPAPREPTPEELEDQRRREALSAATRAATVMASAGTPNVDSPHVPGGVEGVGEAIEKD